MKKKALLLSSCILLSFGNTAFAMDIRGDKASFYERNKPEKIGLNYTYLDVGYLNTSIENDGASDDKVQSLNIGVSFDITQRISGLLKISGGAYKLNNRFSSTTELYVGALYHHPVSKSADLIAGYQLISIGLTDTQNTATSEEVSGHALSLALRHKASETIEWGASANFYDVENETGTQIQLSIAYGSDKGMQYIAAYQTTDTENKQTAFSLGLRFNYD